METVTIKGIKRKTTGKQNSKKLRKEANVPCVLYGAKELIHFFIPMAYLKSLVYTPNVYFIELKIEDSTYKTILQEIQFHPVSDLVLHMDFLEISDKKKIKIMVPTKFEGESPGVLKGGLLTKNIRKLLIYGYPKDIPSKISINVSKLDLGQSAKVRDVKTDKCEILMPLQLPVASVITPRALRSKSTAEESESAKSS